jgi:long-chain acyl-CoA synthetase
MTESLTLPHAFLANAHLRGDDVALRYKDDGLWHDISWDGYRKRAVAVAAGLQSRGLQRGDLVATLCANRVEWLVWDMAAQMLGVVTVPIYPTSIADAVGYILSHSGAKAVLAEDGGQMAKLLSLEEGSNAIEHIVLVEGESQDGRVIGWDALVEAGRDTAESHEAIEAGVEDLDPDGMATIVYTSGTTGPPKGAMLSQRNLMAMADSLASVLGLDHEQSSLSFLPLSHIAERLQGQVMAIKIGYAVNMGEGLTKVAENLVETEPSLLVCVPRLWEKYYAKISSGLEGAPPLRRKLFDWATTAGLAAHQAQATTGKVPPLLKVQADVADRLVLSRLRKRLGMARGKAFVSGAAPLSADVGRFFASLGIVIQEVYGQTECAGVCTYNPVDGVKYGTVGIAAPNIEVRIAEDGEILVRGANVFLGYFKNDEATAETVVDGWLHTGDVGTRDAEGYVRITDRKKDIIVTAGGKNVSPQNIENRLKTFEGVSQVVVVGDKRKFLSALITLDEEGLTDLWDREGRKLPPAEARPADADVLRHLQRCIDEVNKGLNSYETIKKFKVLAEDFTVESGELTPSLKVKRRVIQRRFEALIDGFYGEKFV